MRRPEISSNDLKHHVFHKTTAKRVFVGVVALIGKNDPLLQVEKRILLSRLEKKKIRFSTLKKRIRFYRLKIRILSPRLKKGSFSPG